MSPNEDGVLDISPTLQIATGRAVLIQSLICRQMCAKGSIPDAPNEGIDLRSYLREGLTQEKLGSLPSIVQKELERDERVKKAAVSGDFNTVTQVLTLTEVITDADGPFTLTLAVTSVSVELINGSP